LQSLLIASVTSPLSGSAWQTLVPKLAAQQGKSQLGFPRAPDGTAQAPSVLPSSPKCWSHVWSFDKFSFNE